MTLENNFKPSEIITYDYILACWKNKNIDKRFEDLLEKYLEEKIQAFENIRIKDVVRWLTQLVIVLEIALKINKERFQWYYDYWKNLLGREWEVDLEEVIVKWKR